MKRLFTGAFLSALICLLTLSALTVYADAGYPAAPPNDGEAVFVAADNENLMEFDINGKCEKSIIEVNGKKMLCFENIATSTQQMSVYFVPDDNFDATGMAYLEFYVDASTKNTDTWMRIYLTDCYNAVGDTYCGGDYLHYYLLDNGSWSSAFARSDYGCIGIPAGFAGWVRFDLDEFSRCISWQIGSGDGLNVSAISELCISYAVNPEDLGAKVCFGDIRFVKDNGNPSNPYPFTEAEAPVKDVSLENAGEVIICDPTNCNVYTLTGDNSQVTLAGTLFKLRTTRVLTNNTSVVFADEGIDASGMEYLEFWLDTTRLGADVPMFIALWDSAGACVDGSNADIHPTVWLYDKSGMVKTAFSTGHYLLIPANFSGIVRIDLSEYFKSIPSNGNGNGNSLDISSITQLCIYYPSYQVYSGNSAYIADVKFVKAVSGQMKEYQIDTTPVTETPETNAPETEAPETAAPSTGTDNQGSNPGTGSFVAISVICAAVCGAGASALIIKKKKNK